DPNDIATIVENITGKAFSERKTLNEFGDMQFNGTYTGLLSDFVSYGYLKSSLGNLEIDLLFKNRKNSIKFNGTLAAVDFGLGRLINTPLIGQAGFNIMVDGTLQNSKNDISGKGNISLFEFNGYKYHNVEFDGWLVNQSFNGRIKIDEPNLNFNFDGNIDLAGDDGTPVFKFKAGLKHADLVKLNFNKRDSLSTISANIDANFEASNILNYVGKLTIDSLLYSDVLGNVDLGTIILSSHNSENRNRLELKSGFMDAGYFGQNDLGSFVEQLKCIIQSHVPELLSEKPNTKSGKSGVDGVVDVHIKKAEDIARIIVPGLYIEKDSKMYLKIDTASKITVEITSGKISYNNNHIAGLKLSCDNRSDSLTVNLSGSLITPPATINNFTLKNSILHDRILTRFLFADSVNESNTDISFATQLLHGNGSKGKLQADIQFDDADITLFGQRWNIAPTALKIEKDRFNIEGFTINRRGQKIEISGTVSQNPNDSLRIFLTDYRLRGFNRYIAALGYQIGGKVSGEIDIYGLYGSPYMISSIIVDTLVVNNDTVGNVSLGSMWNNDKQCLDITSRISYNNMFYSSVYGYVFPGSGKIDADINVKNFKTRLIEPLLDGIITDIDGTLNGDVKITGTLVNPNVSGSLNLDNVGLTVDYLKTHYTVNSTVDITNSKLSIQNGQIRDIAGNTGVLNMSLTHNYFKNIKFDASANVKNFLSLNTKSKDNPLFYGAAYTSGVVNLTGDPNLINISITAETGTNSFFYIPLSSTSQVREYDFLTFVDNETGSTDSGEDEQNKQNKQTETPANSKSNIKLGFDLVVTPKSEIQILIDPKVGDILRARGSGNLKINVDPALSLFNIIGDYSIEEGDYNFTLPNISIVSRKFTINRGSRIRFNGDIASAELNVTASYRERVSLAGIFPEDSLRNHPVECQIFITGRMTNPLLKFNINIHDIDPEKKAQFANLVNTDEKMTRQFLSLLVLKAFLPEQSFASQDLGSTTLMYNASELLSGQISNLISMFNLPVPLDVNVDYSANANNNSGTGFGIDVSTQLFDRVILNGSASNTTTSNRSFVGDIEMEVLLGKNENTRFKVFSKSRDYFSDDMESNRNGIGLSYRSQFNKFIDIFRRKKKKDK
ncbi:MAG: translocation/assembly module TamB, partial [Prevotellaceae bacterium]|nr:translocation/assembly module TamB [Prevotellaceae bacterium]